MANEANTTETVRRDDEGLPSPFCLAAEAAPYRMCELWPVPVPMGAQGAIKCLYALVRGREPRVGVQAGLALAPGTRVIR